MFIHRLYIYIYIYISIINYIKEPISNKAMLMLNINYTQSKIHNKKEQHRECRKFGHSSGTPKHSNHSEENC